MMDTYRMDDNQPMGEYFVENAGIIKFRLLIVLSATFLIFDNIG